MNKPTAAFKKIIAFLTIVVLALLSQQSFSQQSVSISRVAVTVAQSKTNIWISDFPKKTTVMLVDAENNLLAILSTNDYGAAYTTLSKPVTSVIIARTLNGEINVQNKALSKVDNTSEAISVDEPKDNNKA